MGPSSDLNHRVYIFCPNAPLDDFDKAIIEDPIHMNFEFAGKQETSMYSNPEAARFWFKRLTDEGLYGLDSIRSAA